MVNRCRLSEKVKVAKTRKLKSWQKAKNINHVEEKLDEDSPDTSDFSSDDDESEVDNNEELGELMSPCETSGNQSDSKELKEIEKPETTETPKKSEPAVVIPVETQK